MPNFDALRTSTLGALSYICRPKVKPEDLYALYTFDNTLSDLSDHHRDIVASNISFENHGIWTMAQASTAASISIGSLASYTVDFFVYVKSLNTVNIFESSAWAIRGLYGNTLKFVTMPSLGQIYAINSMSQDTTHHIAVSQQSGTLYMWIDGGFIGSSNASYNPMSLAGLTAYGAIANLRIVSKCLQTSGTFPVPSTYYTGYEVL